MSLPATMASRDGRPHLWPGGRAAAWSAVLAIGALGCSAHVRDRPAARPPAAAASPRSSGAPGIARAVDHPASGPLARGPDSGSGSPSPSPPTSAIAVEPALTGPELAFWRNRSDLISAPPPPRAVELALPPIGRWTMANGLSVVTVPKAALPIVSFSLAVKAGAYDEQRDDTQSVADFVAAMLRKGTRHRTADEISRTIDFAGGVLDASASAERSVLSCSVLAKDARLCLDLLSDVLMRPTFPVVEMPEVRDQLLAALASRSDDPHLLAADQLDHMIFGDAHPDGWFLLPRHIESITREKLERFWKTFYRPNNAILAVAGSFDPTQMRAAISAAFSPWQSAPIPARPTFKLAPAGATRVVLIDKADLTQATLMFGHAGIRHADPDWYAATLMNYVLGGSDFSSRLMIEVRSRRGLTYGIGSSFGASLYEGAFRVSAATRNQTVGEAFAVSVAEMRRMAKAGPTASELAKARGYYAGSTPLSLESAADLAGSVVVAELHGLGIEYVRHLAVALSAVTAGEAKAAAARWLHPDELSVVIVGRAEAIRPQLERAHLAYRQVDYQTLVEGSRGH